MHSKLSYILAAGAGFLTAHVFSRAPELRSMRLSQLVFVPAAFVTLVYFLPDASSASPIGDVGNFVCFLAVLGFLIVLLSPNMAYYCGAGLSNFLDPQDWTSTEEEIALRPIRRLIDRDHYHQALAELDKILKSHKPTYEALLLKSKLLHQCGRLHETVAALLSLIALSQTTAQQLAVMELLGLLEEYQQEAPKPIAAQARRIQIHHELILFQMSGDASPPHKEIPPGAYKVEETLHRNRRWLKLAGEDWGNAEICWEAIAAMDLPAAAPPKKGLFWRIARMHQAISLAIKGKPRHHRQAEAQKLLNEANRLIRGDDWPRALPLLQRASACDPDRYEIAYRWAQAARLTGSDAATAQVVSRVLAQSQWTENEEQMLNQLKRPIVK
jgi:thioredoxin-like negative regulator of GroEL